MRKIAIVAAVIGGTVPCYPQGSNTTNGSCSPIITGNQNSNITNNCNVPKQVPKPSLSEIESSIKDYNDLPIYEIEGVKYRNGYFEQEGKYVVGVAIKIQTKMSCKEMIKGTWIPEGASREERIIIAMAIINVAYMFGKDCKTGEKFSLLYTNELQKTEKGWVIINQESNGAERR